MEPAFRQREEKQAYYHVRRYGQKSKVVYWWRACCPDIAIEGSIMERQKLMAWVEEKTMEARASLYKLTLKIAFSIDEGILDS